MLAFLVVPDVLILDSRLAAWLAAIRRIDRRAQVDGAGRGGGECPALC